MDQYGIYISSEFSLWTKKVLWLGLRLFYYSLIYGRLYLVCRRERVSISNKTIYSPLFLNGFCLASVQVTVWSREEPSKDTIKELFPLRETCLRKSSRLYDIRARQLYRASQPVPAQAAGGPGGYKSPVRPVRDQTSSDQRPTCIVSSSPSCWWLWWYRPGSSALRRRTETSARLRSKLAPFKSELILGVLGSLLGFWVSKLNLSKNSNWLKQSFCCCSGHIKSILFQLARGWI